MGQIEDLRLFVNIVESGSISKAADKMNIAKSAVSRRLGLLEARYESKLIDRAPGFWGITDTGRELHRRAIRVVGEMAEIEDDFVNAAAGLTGPLSVSVPRDFGIIFLNSVLIKFQSHYPDIQLTVDFEDRTVDLARENYDFAIRITQEHEGEIAGSLIGKMRHCLLASPNYLETHSVPCSLEDLSQHQLFYFGTARRAVWEFLNERGVRQSFEFQPFLNSNSGAFLLEATLSGLGISRLPDFISADALARGDLVQVMPDMSVPDWGIYLVHDDSRRFNRRMRLFSEEVKHACLFARGN